MKKYIYVPIFVILTCLLFFNFSAFSQQTGCDADRFFNTVFEEVTVTSGIQYGQNTTLGGTTIDLMMDIYEPTGDQLEKRPVIVFAHGGGFVGGEREDMDYICKDFAQRGFVTATITYRLADVPLSDPLTTMNEVIMAVGDMKAAVRFFREDAALDNLYKTDPDFIFVGGSSAGAIMSSNLGYLDSMDPIAPALWDIINSHGGLEGNSSLNTSYSSAVQGVLNYSGSIVTTIFIDADDPPLYSFHNEFDDVLGCGDDPISGSGSCEMHAAAEAVGIKNKFHLYSESDGHVLWPYTYVRHETAQFLGEILCGEAPATEWEEASSGFNNPGFAIVDIEVVNEDVVWLIAVPSRFDVAAQNFARSVDGGQTWTTGVIPVSDPEYGSYSISALDGNTAWVTTYGFENHAGGEVYKTTDGGVNWTEQSSAFTEPDEAPHGIHFFDDKDGFAFTFVEDGTTDSHAGYITSDGGENWEKLTSDVYPAQPGERIVDANLDFMEAKGDHLWIGMRNGNVYHSTDRGHTWEVNNVSTTQSIASVAFKDEMNGIAVSNFNTSIGIYFNKAYATSDGGVTWSEIPVPPSPATAGIHFVEGSADAPGACGAYVVYYQFTNGGGPGTAYTTDDGQTWTFISEQPVYSIDFASPEIGWVGGITHGSDNGLFKWTGDVLTGNENCISSSNENIVDHSNLLIYPNPASDVLNIELENTWQGELTLRIVNTLGQEVYFETFSKNIDQWKGQIELSQIPAGIYQVMVSDGSKMMVKPMVKQ